MGVNKKKHVSFIIQDMWASTRGLFLPIKQVQLIFCLCSRINVYVWIKA